MILVQVAAGELVDKISILEIKATRIADPAKAANIAAELKLLRDVAAAAGMDGELNGLAAELRAINESIWDAEEGLRSCEAEGYFGDRFIALARSIYRNNDRRAALKRKINLACVSAIIEEKSY